VGLSYNPYVWSEQIDPEAGVLRLVFGLGTRAVDRSDDDYTRLVALNAPQRRPDAERSGSPAFSQRRVDLLDLRANRFASERIDDVARVSPDLPIDLYAVRRSSLPRGEGAPLRPSDEGWVLTFGKLLSETPFVRTSGRCWGSSGTPTNTRWTPSSRETSFRTGGASSTSCNAGRCR